MGQERLLTEVEAKELLSRAGIPVTRTVLAHTRAESVRLAKEMGYPVVLKIVSPDISHKSDIGGVKLNLNSSAQVGKAYRDMIAAVQEQMPGAKLEGISVQKMASPGIELIIGMSKDAQFGPVIMFGLGGILVEVLKDVSFRVVPLNSRDASQMIREIKGYSMLTGFRGRPPVDLAALEKITLAVSHFVENNPQVKELDLNPLIANKDGIIAVDARIVLG